MWLYLWLVLFMLKVTETLEIHLCLYYLLFWGTAIPYSAFTNIFWRWLTETHLYICHLSLLPRFQLCFKSLSVDNIFCKLNIYLKHWLIILDFSVVLTSCVHSHHGSSFPPWKFLPLSFQNDGCRPIQFLIRFLNLFNNLLCFCLNLFHFNLDMIEIKTF